MDLYDIPVIQPDLRHEETIIQIANAFDLLQQVITDVFDKVDERIRVNSNAVQNIDSRIDKINRKIDELSNNCESIDIQSPYDYPAVNLFKDIPMTLTMSNRKAIHLNRQYHIESGPDSNISKTYEKKLQFYYVRQPKHSTSSAGSVSSKEAHAYLESGLGSVPSYIDSINALLLFNKSENIFDKKTQKNLRRFEQSAVRYYDPVLSEGRGEIEKAPVSITTRQLLNMRIRKNLFMATQWNDDEQIEIPIMLPDVSGLKDKKKKKIVQSSEEKMPEKMGEEQKSVQTKSVPPNETLNVKSQNESEASSSVVDSAPVPPPIPPPMATNSEVPTSTPKAPPPKLNSNTLDRSSLMEAIRQAGGAQKMKKKVDIERDDIKEKMEKAKKQPVAFSSGGLMDDLHKKLALRRKGISGNKDLAQGSNVMDGISAMIPPPPPKQSDSSSESETNDDWN